MRDKFIVSERLFISHQGHQAKHQAESQSRKPQHFAMDAPQTAVISVPDFSLKEMSGSASASSIETAGGSERVQASVATVVASGTWCHDA